MQSVSIIFDGSNLDEHHYSELSKRSLRLSTEGIRCEYIAYVDELPKDRFLDGVSLIDSKSSAISSFDKAIVAACGDNLVFTTANNVLSDTGNNLIVQAASLCDFHIAVPTKRTLGKAVRASGLRYVEEASYFIASKPFASSYSQLMNTPKKAIQQADRQLALKFIPAIDEGLPDILINRFAFSRPYITLFRHYSRIARIRYKAYRKRRRDYRLSLRVPPVPYAPDMPVFIICRDRVQPLKKLVKWCEQEGLTNIIFIDNASTYKPLLDYYEKTSYEVIRLRANVGHTSPWLAGVVDVYAKDRPFIVSDPDVIPVTESHGAVERFCELLTNYPERRKVGFGLKIDDLPNHYDLKKHVISWEKQFWVTEKEKDVYDAEIDTTFAVYRQNTPYVLGPALRTGGNLVARHEPWYINSQDIPDEVKYYRSQANKVVGSWGVDASDVSETYANNAFKTR